MAITIVGLGPGSPGMITREAWEVLTRADQIYLRTKVHPTVEYLPKDVAIHSFDDAYEQAQDFNEVYRIIVDRLVSQAEHADIVYAVPGDPLIAEGTVSRLLAVCRVKNIDIRIVSGVSFIEPTLAALGRDGIEGFQLVDAFEIASLHHPNLNPDKPALIAQIFGKQLASDVKLTLMNQYPDHHPVTIVQAAGTSDQLVKHVALFEIDRFDSNHLSTLFIPPLTTEGISSFDGFQETIARLRAPDGCPWDREQTHESLRSYLVEETYEVLDAIESGDAQLLCEELGDLLLQVVLHTQIGIDEGEFAMPDVIQQIDSKIKRRHPHVWGDVDVKGSAEQVAMNWQHIKAQERAGKETVSSGILDGVSRSLPALALAHEYDRRAAQSGFDWPDVDGVIAKINEELKEVLEAESPKDKFREIGDLLLSVAVLARWMKISAEDALRAACSQFYRRFSYLETEIRQTNKQIRDLSPQELDAVWLRAKAATSGQ